MPRSDAGTINRARSRIQRLCRLGIGGEMLMPDLIREVVRLIPAGGGFFWLGTGFGSTNLYAPVSPMPALYLQEFYNRREFEIFSAALGNWALFRGPAVKARQHSVIVDRATLLRSTVVMHLRSIHEKLGVHSRGGLIAALQPA